MPYDPAEIRPMRDELAAIGFTELASPAEVDSFLAVRGETVLVAINSVCGCAAGMMRPGVRKSLDLAKRPLRLGTAFAGADLETVERIREYLGDIPPSSPAVALFRNGEPVFYMGRNDIEGSSSASIAARLGEAYERFCP